MYWLIIFTNGEQRIIEAEDFYGVHNQLDSNEVSAVIHLKNCMKEPTYE